MEASVEAGNVALGICLDESGSMGDVRESTISGFNEYLDELRSQPGRTSVSLTMFSDTVAGKPVFRPFHENVDIADAESLGPKNYNPSGNTPLYDAIGHTIAKMQSWLTGRSEAWTVLFVIQTDGFENASREYTRERVFELIRAKESEGWKFIYLGADQDKYAAERAATASGMSVGSTVSYAKSSTAASYASLGQTVSSLRTNSAMSSREVAEEVSERLERAKEEEGKKDPSKPNF